ncbi:MAG: peptide chain release factor N(5)-glutamine methyltransferase [Chloroflexota bacterium]|nr:peptide chain release factor N(5)-glutamine methyltransferase [Chloroflexota bacterium]
MKVKEALRGVATNLAIDAVEEAPLEAELLLMHVLGLDRAGLYVALEDDLSPERRVTLSEMVDRRLRREPLAYITGRREFFGLDFYVGPEVLIPRPETELLVEEVIAFVERNFPCGDPVIADIGTGSGAIAVSLAVSLPRARGYAVDISARALEIAQVNCLRHNVGVELLEGDILSQLPEAMDVIVANLPYVRDGDMDGLCEEIREHEPRVALSGGKDGLDVVRRLIAGAPERLRPGGLVLLEVAPDQVQAIVEFASGIDSWRSVDSVADIGGVPRALRLILTKHCSEV